MTQIPSPANPPERLLCGPGPCNVSPAALAALQKPLLGHMDPDFADILLEVVALQRIAYEAEGGLVLPLQSTGTSGMECGLAHLLEPGDTAIIGVNGFFGRRIVEIAVRLGANVVKVDADWGEHVSNDALLEALDQHPDARLICVVHAETSTGVQHPLAELGAALRDRERAADGRLRHLAGRHRAALQRLGDRLRLLLLAEVRRRPARHVAGGGV